MAYAVRNVRRDINNGFIVAEILSRYYPTEVNIYSYYNDINKEKKKDNWNRIASIPNFNLNKDILEKKEFKLTEEE